ncbi:MAG: hypothetical protein HPY66_1548 [Firmicutes bacterium]|nr:hypothetical protein [Bacillota bacterium]
MGRDMGALKYIALITQLGLSMALPIIFGVIVGRYIDKAVGTNSIFLLIFSIIGVLSAFRNLYHIAYRETKRK